MTGIIRVASNRFKPTGFHTCLENLNEAENSWFNDEGNRKYIEWAHKYTMLIRVMLQTTAAEIDAARIKAAVELEDAVTANKTSF